MANLQSKMPQILPSNVQTAMDALEKIIPDAQADPRLPVYHFKAPGGWMGDINGPIYHNGYYHIFYQHRSGLEGIHWGHARSIDLIHWEHLPIALWPSQEEGEEHCYSGDTVIRDDGTPMIFYTSKPSLQQHAAIGDGNLITWQKHQDNPVLPDSVHLDRVKIGGWRDPFVFKESGQTYLICGGWEGTHKAPGHSSGIVSLYRAESEDLTKWTYLGALFHHPDSMDNACPNFFKLGDKWVLLMSRHNPHVCDYFVGTWDADTVRFEPVYSDTLGYTEAVYATQGLHDAKGRLIIWNTLHNHRSTGRLDDWPSCLTLPRVVNLRRDNSLGFAPLPELQTLRGKHHFVSGFPLHCSSHPVDSIRGDTLEIMVEIDPGDAQAFGLRVRRSQDGKRGVEIRYDGALLVDGTAGVFNQDDAVRRPFAMIQDEKTLKVHIFLDKATLEVFANDRACFEKLIHPEEPSAHGLNPPLAVDLGLDFFSEGGRAEVLSLDVWEMLPIKFTTNQWSRRSKVEGERSGQSGIKSSFSSS